MSSRANNVSVNALTPEELIEEIIRTHDHNPPSCSVALKEFCSRALDQDVRAMPAWLNMLIREAKRLRKLLGGGMRQSGILCAGALVGLADYKETFTKDHTHAKRLAEALNELSGFH